MPLFMWCYLLALVVSAVIAAAAYYLVGGAATPFFRELLGDAGGQLGARSFRLLLVMSVCVGGLSTQWYGCHGPTDYQAVASNRRLMLQKTSEQVAQAISYGTSFLVAALVLGGLVYAIRHRRSSSD